MTEFIVQWMNIATILMFTTMIAGLVLLYRNIWYASVDGAAFMSYSTMFTRGIFFEKNFVYDYEYGDVEDRISSDGNKLTFTETFQERVPAFFYNLSINLMKLFPPENRFRGTQLMNTAFYVLFLAMVYLLCSQFAVRVLGDPAMSSTLGLFGFALLGCRGKLMATTMLIYSEILNFLLFGMSFLVAMQMEESLAPGWVLALGALFGLCFRNRQGDLVLLAAGFLYLFYLDASVCLYLTFFGGFILVNADLFVVQIIYRMPAFHYLFSILSSQMFWNRNVRKNSGGQTLKRNCNFFKNMFNPWAPDNYFTSIGANIFLFPCSIGILLFSGTLNGVAVYLLLVAVLYFVALLCARSEDFGTSFFGARQGYHIAICVLLLNCMAFTVLLTQKNVFFFYFYAVVWTLYGLHQVYRVMSYHFCDSIDEKRLHLHKKDPEPYRAEVRDFLASIKRPAVVMGVHLIMGIPLNFFSWSRELRLVEMRVKADDERIAKLIDAYGVTHIILTPHDFPIDRESSLLKQELAPRLKERLIRHVISPQLTVFEVR